MEMWATTETLDPSVDVVNRMAVVLSVDVGSRELPWLTRPSFAGYLDLVLGLDKAPVRRVFRPVGWPAWNAEFRIVARFWSRDDGLDEDLIDDLRQRREPPLVEPNDAEFTAQMRDELEVSRLHLDHVTDSFYERDWRREHKGFGIYPGDHLRWAAAGYRAIEKALAGEPS